ncbi:MAG: transglycosylase domain-containing protein [Micromonosporaceae bacterium]
MKRTRDRGVFANLAMLLVWGLAAGVAVAAAAFPAVAVAGLGAKYGADSFEDLPSELKLRPLAQRTEVYAADKKTLITAFYDENRKYVSLDQIAPVMVDAIVAAEDQRFYEHHGVDVKGILRAMVANHQAGEVKQGASTLTMQYVRQALTYSAQTPAEVKLATEDTAARKLREIRYAVQLEKELSKDEILERYLNIAYYGHRAYGIAAASQVYFSQNPKELLPQQAALLAGLVRAPSLYDPAVNENSGALDRRNWVIDQMIIGRYLSTPEATKAQKTPIGLKLKSIPNDCVGARHNDWGFFCDFFRNWWLSKKEFGSTVNERENLLRRGGFKIVTSLDPKIQATAYKHVLENHPKKSKYALGAVFIEPGSGKVRAMAVNRTYSNNNRWNAPHTDPAKRAKKIKSTYPNTAVPLLGGGDASGYQAGSTMKWFTMLAALENGLKLDHQFYAPGRYTTRFIVEPGGPAACGNRWCPKNASNSMNGVRDMHTGFGMSVNTYFAQLVEKVGPTAAVRMAERLGLRWRNTIDRQLAKHPSGWGAFTLGAPDTTPLEMANAYATAASGGIYCEPLPIDSITGRDGKKVDPPHKCKRAISKDVAWAATDAARCPVGDRPARGSCGSWGTATRVSGIVPGPVAGKTGTTDSNRAAWFIGYNRQLAGAAFMADPDYRLTDVPYDWTRFPASVVAYTLRDFMKGKKPIEFGAPSKKIADGGARARAPKKPDDKPSKKPNNDDEPGRPRETDPITPPPPPGGD